MPPPRVIGGLTAVVAFVAFVVVRANPLVAPSSSSSFFIRTANATARVVLVRVLAPPAAFHRRVDIVVDIVDIVVVIVIIIVAAQSNQSNRIESNQSNQSRATEERDRAHRPTDEVSVPDERL